jgi:hypothetical protein
MAVSNTIFGKYAIGGFCCGLMAGGLMVFFLNVLGGGSNVALPFGFAVAGAVGAYTQLKDV